jgi:hypothetical protein
VPAAAKWQVGEQQSPPSQSSPGSMIPSPHVGFLNAGTHSSAGFFASSVSASS